MSLGGNKDIGEVRVRRAVPEDLESIVRFNAAMALETEGKVLDAEKLQEGVAAVFQCQGLGFYCVAEVAGQVVGQLMITTEWSDWRNSYYWWIQSVYVHPDHRRRGVFRTLYAHLKTLAESDPGVVGLRLYVEHDNQVAQTTYEGLGMTPAHYRIMQHLFARSG